MDIQDLQSADYKLTWFEPGDFTDNHGNYWCNAAFEGISEPVRWVVKDPSQVNVGETYYGRFTLETSKAKKTYIRFRREQKPDAPHAEPQQAALLGKQTDTYWDDKNASIRAQFALKTAVQGFNGAISLNDRQQILDTARMIYGMVDEVKDHPQAPLVKQQPLLVEAPKSGYEKAKATAHAIKQTFSDGSPVPDEVYDNFDESEPIDLKDIPF